MGTRSGSEKRQLSKQLTARVSEQTYAAVVAQANDAGDELATWLRDRFDVIAADTTTAPRRRRSKRAPLSLDINALKELSGQAGQLCGAIILMLRRERLPFARVERDELVAIHDELLALKGRMVALLAEASK